METDWLDFDNSSSLCNHMVEQGQRSLAVRDLERVFPDWHGFNCLLLENWALSTAQSQTRNWPKWAIKWQMKNRIDPRQRCHDVVLSRSEYMSKKKLAWLCMCVYMHDACDGCYVQLWIYWTSCWRLIPTSGSRWNRRLHILIWHSTMTRQMRSVVCYRVEQKWGLWPLWPKEDITVVLPVL